MAKENQEDGFVILQENEVLDSKYEALNNIRFGNNSLDKQFKRDIELMSLAIVEYGQSEQDKIKAEALLKSMLLLFFGKVCYRHSADQRFYPLDTLNTYFKTNTTLANFPIAAILLHGSRALIEFPKELASQVMDWLIIDKNSWRYMATHGISVLTEAEEINYDANSTNLPICKHLKEEKLNATQAAIHFVSHSITATYTQNNLEIAEHYGIDIALGGVGNSHFASKKIIQNNGEYGHLYIHFYQDGSPEKNTDLVLGKQQTKVPEKRFGLLVSCEQSAPGKPDQFGSKHDLNVSDKAYSVSGGDFFCKKPILQEMYQKDYQGLSGLPFANYYDSLWNFITEDAFSLIKANFEKCKCLLSLVSKEKILPFIQHILSSSGGAKPQDFDQLFAHYFQEIPLAKKNANRQANIIKNLQTRYEGLRVLYHEKQQVEAQAVTQLLSLEQQLECVEYANEANQQESKEELIQLFQRQLSDLQKEKNSLFFNLSKCFMQDVIQHMGWRANKSQKQIIMLSLQQLDTAEIELNDDYIRNLLKNFMGVSLMNRYGFNTGPTHSARACLHCLGLLQYQPLKSLLFSRTDKIDYKDLVTLIAGDEIENKQTFISAKYKKNLYRFYQEVGKSKNQVDQNKLILATQQLVYTI